MSIDFDPGELLELLERRPSKVSQDLRAYLQEYSVIFVPRDREALPLFLSTENARANVVGHLMVEFDRELRRSVDLLTVAKARNELAEGRWPRTSGPSSLLVTRTRSSSLDILIEVYDQARDLLLSDPIQLLATLTWLFQFRPRTWGLPRPSTRRTLKQIVKLLQRSARNAINSGQPFAFQVEFDAEGNLSTSFRVFSADDEGDEE